MSKSIVAWGLVILLAVPQAGWAQRAQSASAGGQQDPASVVPQLRRKISLELEGVSVDSALQVVAKKAALSITYSDAILPSARRVSLSADSIRADQALKTILRDSGLHLRPLSTGQVVVVRDSVMAGGAPERRATATVSGRITDKVTGVGIAGAKIALVLPDSALRAVTGDSGAFRVARVPVGEHTIVVQQKGYRVLSDKVAIDPAPAPINLALEADAPADCARVMASLFSALAAQQQEMKKDTAAARKGGGLTFPDSISIGDIIMCNGRRR